MFDALLDKTTLLNPEVLMRQGKLLLYCETAAALKQKIIQRHPTPARLHMHAVWLSHGMHVVANRYKATCCYCVCIQSSDACVRFDS
jgi:hypothetical protein